MTSTTEWTLKPGDRILRKELHARYGGRVQGGIGPSKSSPNVFLFADPVSAQKHGYTDGPGPNGIYHYTGEGQHGDQVMKSGNGSIFWHRKEGRKLRLFHGARGEVTYVGEYTLDPEQPYYETDAPESGETLLDRAVRSVIVFRLRPVDDVPDSSIVGSPERTEVGPAETLRVDPVPIEAHLTERSFVEPEREPYEAERREARLVSDFRDYMHSRGNEVQRLRILPEGEAKPLYTDLYVPSLNLLVEAKGTKERGAIRMALGQLLDYRRFIEWTRCAILLPARPRGDLERLVLGAGFDLYWQVGDTFHHEPSSAERTGDVGVQVTRAA